MVYAYQHGERDAALSLLLYLHHPPPSCSRTPSSHTRSGSVPTTSPIPVPRFILERILVTVIKGRGRPFEVCMSCPSRVVIYIHNYLASETIAVVVYQRLITSNKVTQWTSWKTLRHVSFCCLFVSGCFYPFSTLLGGRIAAMSHGMARIRLGRLERVLVTS